MPEGDGTTSPVGGSPPPGISLPSCLTDSVHDRLVDYFLVLGVDASSWAHNLTLGDYYSAVKAVKTMAIPVKTTMLDRYPFADRVGRCVPPHIYEFCFPNGASMCGENDVMLPLFYTFVLTGADGSRMYGSCLLFYERLSEDDHRKLTAFLYERLKALKAVAKPPLPPKAALTKTGESQNEAVSDVIPESPQKTESTADRASPVVHSLMSISPLKQPSKYDITIEGDSGAEGAETEVVEATSGDVGDDASLSTPQDGHVSAELNRILRGDDDGDSASFKSEGTDEGSECPSMGGASGEALDLDLNLDEPFALPDHVYAPKCLCLVSRVPLYSVFKAFLTDIFRISITPSNIPLERYICNFVAEVPMPPRGFCQLQHSLSTTTVYISRPPINDLPLSDVPYENVFQALSVPNLLHIFECVLLERKILLHSRYLSLLTTVAEAVTALIYPFYWQHVYIPVLPRRLFEFLAAPVPFLMGMHNPDATHASVKELMNGLPDPETVVVDLDGNQVHDRRQDMPRVPDKQLAKLKLHLSQLLEDRPLSRQVLNMDLDHAFPMVKPPDEIDDEIVDEITGEVHKKTPVSVPRTRARRGTAWQPISMFRSNNADQDRGAVGPSKRHERGSIDNYEIPIMEIRYSFFRFFVSLFSDYRKYLIAGEDLVRDEADDEAYFRKRAFVQSIPPAARAFVREFLKTQMFENFARHRALGIPNKYEIRFFDEHILIKENRSRWRLSRKDTPFLRTDRYQFHKTLVTPSVDVAGLDTGTPFTSPKASGMGRRSFYQQFARLEHKNFPMPRAFSLPDDVRHAVFGTDGSNDGIGEVADDFAFPDVTGANRRADQALLESWQISLATLRAMAQRQPAKRKGSGTGSALMERPGSAMSKDSASSQSTDSHTIHQRTRSVLRFWNRSRDHDNEDMSDALTRMQEEANSLGHAKSGAEDQAGSFFRKHLTFDTEAECPQCQHKLTDAEIRMGWSRLDLHDYRTTCIHCGYQFVPRFRVTVWRRTGTNENAPDATSPHSPLPEEVTSPTAEAAAAADIIEAADAEPATEAHSAPPPLLRTNTVIHNAEAGTGDAANAGEDAGSGADGAKEASAAAAPESAPGDNVNNSELSAEELSRQKRIENARKRMRSMSNRGSTEADGVRPVLSKTFYCEYLSPSILQKEIGNLLRKDVLCDASLFRKHPTVFLNLLWHFSSLHMPLAYLLPQVDWDAIYSELD